MHRTARGVAVALAAAAGLTFAAPAHAACTAQLNTAPNGASTSCSNTPATAVLITVSAGSVKVEVGCGGVIVAFTNVGPGVTPLFFSPCTAGTVYLTATSNGTTATAVLS